MKYIHSIFCVIVVCTYAVLVGVASAAQPVGSAIKIQRDVMGFGVSGARNLSVSDAVYRNEEISASLKSHGELELSDGSKIIVGENSVVVLDDFVVGDSGFKSGTLKVIKGAFRFVTGSSKKGTFTVTTPLATIGVRGTFFDVYVRDGKETVVLFRGEVRVCSNSGCRTANRSCDVIEIAPTGVVEKAPFLGSSRARNTDRDYNLVENQGRFSKPLRAPRRLCNARAAMEVHNPGENDGGDGEETDNTPGRGENRGPSQGQGQNNAYSSP